MKIHQSLYKEGLSWLYTVEAYKKKTLPAECYDRELSSGPPNDSARTSQKLSKLYRLIRLGGTFDNDVSFKPATTVVSFNMNGFRVCQVHCETRQELIPTLV